MWTELILKYSNLDDKHNVKMIKIWLAKDMRFFANFFFSRVKNKSTCLFEHPVENEIIVLYIYKLRPIEETNNKLKENLFQIRLFIWENLQNNQTFPTANHMKALHADLNCMNFAWDGHLNLYLPFSFTQIHQYGFRMIYKRKDNTNNKN